MPELTRLSNLSEFVELSRNLNTGFYGQQDHPGMQENLGLVSNQDPIGTYTMEVLTRAVDMLWKPEVGIEPPIQATRIDVVGGRLVFSSMPFVTEQGGVLWKFFSYDSASNLSSPQLYYLFGEPPQEFSYPLGVKPLDFSFFDIPKTVQPYKFVNIGARYSEGIPLVRIFKAAGWQVRSNIEPLKRSRISSEEVANFILTEFAKVPQPPHTR